MCTRVGFDCVVPINSLALNNFSLKYQISFFSEGSERSTHTRTNMASTVDSGRVRERVERAESLARKVKTLAQWVRSSEYTVFYTGAGVSTSAGVGDYRGPTGAWTMDRVKELESLRASGRMSKEERAELVELRSAAERKGRQRKVPMIDAQPTLAHMAMASLIRRDLAHYVVTTNLDGIHRKSGLAAHKQVANLHGCVYAERCTGCGYDFERNYNTRRCEVHVHDHHIGTCSRCGSRPPRGYDGRARSRDTGAGTTYADNGLVSTRCKNVGTKDTHINFGENLDEVDWDETDHHCRRADLVIVAGSSMSLRHITHFPFLAKRTVIINLQPTPDDAKCHLRVWGKTDTVFHLLMGELGLPIDPVPAWRPHDAVPIASIPEYVNPYYVRAAERLETTARRREAEARARQAVAEKRKADEKQREEKARAPTQASPRHRALDLLRSGLRIGNLHQVVAAKTGDTDGSAAQNTHRWTMFVSACSAKAPALAPLVDRVVYKLHPSFSPAQVSVKNAPDFQLTRLGWGTFTVRVCIHWTKAVGLPPTQLTHDLDFAQAVASTDYRAGRGCLSILAGGNAARAAEQSVHMYSVSVSD